MTPCHPTCVCALRWAICLAHKFTRGLWVNFHTRRWQGYFWCLQMLMSMVGPPPIHGLTCFWGASMWHALFSQSYSRVHPHNVCLTFNLSIVPIKISFHNIGWPWLWPCHRRGQWPCVKKKGDGVCVCVGGGAGVSTKILFKDLTLYEHFQICLIVLTSLHDSSP
jgi:hypothetical protein